jgi:lipopolysaccharide biosynthesis regulator YciM
MLDQRQKIKLASYYHEQAYKACIEKSDYYRAREFYEKTLKLNPADALAQFNLNIIKVVT